MGSRGMQSERIKLRIKTYDEEKARADLLAAVARGERGAVEFMALVDAEGSIECAMLECQDGCGPSFARAWALANESVGYRLETGHERDERVSRAERAKTAECAALERIANEPPIDDYEDTRGSGCCMDTND